MAGGSLSEDTASLWGNSHRSQMAPDSSPLPQAVGAGAGAGLGGAGRGLEMERWMERGAGARENMWRVGSTGWKDWGWYGVSMNDQDWKG